MAEPGIVRVNYKNKYIIIISIYKYIFKGHMGFLPPHPGLVPGMEQPLPMSGTLGQDHHYPPDTKPSMSDMPFNMSGKMMSEGFNMSNMQADMRDMIAHPQDFNSPGDTE